jgi:phospholipase C
MAREPIPFVVGQIVPHIEAEHKRTVMQKVLSTSVAALMLATQVLAPAAVQAQRNSTASPIKHVVIIFGENISFDHYFGTYPNAKNPGNEPRFVAAPGTPSVNGYTAGLLLNNPNLLNKAGNAGGASNPFRLDRSQAATSDQDHDYGPEQQAFHGGLMDSFPQFTGTPGPPPSGQGTKGLVMGYYDGNTVTALWNYAQHFAMSDNSYNTTFGPSSPGAINLVSGQTNGISDQSNASGDVVEDGDGGFTLISDADPIGDVCSTTTGALVQLSGKNVGDLLNARGITWGFFEGGFNLATKNPDGSTGCSRSHTSAVTNTKKADYIPHHQPFQYYTSTANPKHLRPSSAWAIGQTDQANHQYDTDDFFKALAVGNFPAVSYLKAPGFQDAHAGYSDPLDEQAFVVNVINILQLSRDWDSTAVFIAYDDSDGWYDHQLGQIVNQSTTAADALTGPGACGNGTDSALPGVSGQHAQGRCGYGPRLPLLLISPYAKQNYVDHTMTDQTSILRFIEDNWLEGERIGNGSFDALAGTVNGMFDFSHRANERRLFLDNNSGEPIFGR